MTPFRWLVAGWALYALSFIPMVVVLNTTGSAEVTAFVIQIVLCVAMFFCYGVALYRQRHPAQEKPWYVDYDKQRSKENYL